MDKIQFILDSDKQVTDIFINKSNLIDIMRAIETPFAEREGLPNIAGSYMGLYPNGIFPPSKYFLGSPLYGDKTRIFRCGNCETEGCWPLTVKITVQGEYVIWSEFEQPHRKDNDSIAIWDYQDLQFVFDRLQYEEELLNHQQHLKAGKTTRVRIVEDRELGWVIEIRSDFEYFENTEDISLIVDESKYKFQIIDTVRQYWNIASKEQEDDGWPIHLWIESVRFLHFPENPKLLHNWLNLFMDLDAFLERRKSSFFLNPKSNPQVQSTDGICLILTLPATINVLDPDSLFELIPHTEQYQKYQKS